MSTVMKWMWISFAYKNYDADGHAAKQILS